MIVSTFIALLLPTLLGFAVVSAILRNDRETGILERISLSYPLGTALMTMQMFLLGLMRIPMTLIPMTVPLIVEILALGVWIWKNKIIVFPPPTFGLYNEIASSKNHWIVKAAVALLVLWTAAKLGSLFIESYLRPIYAWDAWANWSAGAKTYYYAKNLLLDAPAAEFFGKGVAGRVLSYPLHTPLMQVWMSLWLGAFDEVFVKFWSPCYLLSMAVYLYLLASREINRLAALAILAIFLSSPLMSYHAIEAYSDLPLGAYLFFTSAAFLLAMRNRQSYWLLAGFFSAGALFIKNEAVPFIAPLYVSIFAYIWFIRKQGSSSRIVYSILTPLVLVLPWFIFKYSHSLSLYPEFFSIKLAYHPGVLDRVIDEFASLQNFNIIFIALPVLIGIGGRPARELLHLFFPFLFYTVFFVGLYTLTLYNEFLMQGTIFFRNALTYYPLACLLIILLLKKSAPVAAAVLPEPKQRRTRHRKSA